MDDMETVELDYTKHGFDFKSEIFLTDNAKYLIYRRIDQDRKISIFDT
jgi:hypothetical protein